MIIVIVENDPFVRIDIVETLRANFAQSKISSVATLHQVQKVAADILIADAELNQKALVSWLSQGATIIFTGPGKTDTADAEFDGIVRLQRPFSQDMLLHAVRRAMARQGSG
ncbi:DNA-binding transcriptional response regulator [Pseudooctadecabacter jejudonensis]|uniref:Response regulatory domain-containing protein n=1 Tax=Pseudooctadecabacter jejudonensis TaxID=1391910 RepID=A0A1Y5TDU0_9RHOB|nr:hypothetical protein [Pseudooctadecabacter jejudonensis]SLN58069.1 hypothetical protein PSJ8397_03036 [Pseudooctadecabacter jejudonensis]